MSLTLPFIVHIDPILEQDAVLRSQISESTDFFAVQYINLPPDEEWSEPVLTWKSSITKKGYLQVLLEEKHVTKGTFTATYELLGSDLKTEYGRESRMYALLRCVTKHRRIVIREQIEAILALPDENDG
jgi:hypothetical protein